MATRIINSINGEDKVQKSLVEELNKYENQEEARKSRLFLTRKEYSSGLSRKLSENKPNPEIGLTLS